MNLKPRRLMLAARLRRVATRTKHLRRKSPSVAKTESKAEELAHFLILLRISQRPVMRELIQQLNPGLKITKSQNQYAAKADEPYQKISAACETTASEHHSWDQPDHPQWMSWKQEDDFPEVAEQYQSVITTSPNIDISYMKIIELPTNTDFKKNQIPDTM
ncbi:hypothetical protein J0S82_002970, partial [Galemys pyrenaicus]